MSPLEILAKVAELLAHVPAPLLKEAIDIVEGKPRDTVAEFEVRRDAFTEEVLQRRLKERFAP
jgi:hypothetical protein